VLIACIPSSRDRLAKPQPLEAVATGRAAPPRLSGCPRTIVR
jgi:hypothetical protein